MLLNLQNNTKIRNRIMKKSFLFILLFFMSFSLFSQCGELRVVFWNLENFFDPYVDSTLKYNDYTPDGPQHWSLSRFYKKRNNIYKAILSLSEGVPLAVIGLCEIENTFVTTMLFQDTPLKRHNYRVVHYEGDDRRGIDVAIAYSVDKLQLVNSKAVKVRDVCDKGFKTRDILYAKFYDKVGDTLHCFVNHWPSRYGGEKETIYYRSLAASVLRAKIDSLMNVCVEMPKIVVMGDFNDTPYDNSIIDVLGAVPCQHATKEDALINLFSNAKDLGFSGTLKHKYTWQIFDQIMLSNALLYADKTMRYKKKSASIFHADFLFMTDDTYGGKKLFRTYVGPKYQGGYSDHLPVYIDLINDG